MPKEQEQHHCHENASKPERMPDVDERRLDERRGPVQARIEFDAFLLEHRAHLAERIFERVGHFERVRSVLARHGQQHAGPALDEGVAELWLRALDDARDVLEPERRAVGRIGQRHFAEHFRRERLALGLEHDALIRCLHEACAAHAGGQARGVEHVGHRQAMRLDLNLNLSHLAAERAALGDAGHGEQAGLERPVGEGPQLHWRKLVGDETHLEQIHRRGRERRHLGWFHSDGQLASKLAKLLT